MSLYRFSLDPSYLFNWVAGLAAQSRHLSVINEIRRYAESHLASYFRDEDDLKKTTLYAFLASCHAKLSSQLTNRFPGLLRKLARELKRTARTVYGVNDFAANEGNALDSLAIHGLFAHGTSHSPLPATKPAITTTSRFLLDFSGGADIYADYEGPELDSMFFSMLLHNHPALAFRADDPPNEGKCHLCDSLLAIYKRVTAFRGIHPKDLFDEDHNVVGSLEAIKITARLSSVLAFRFASGSTDNKTIADNASLLSIARRRGLAVPIISSIIPYDVWNDVSVPVRDFLLDAAEVVGADHCPPLSRVPHEQEIEEAVRRMQDVSSPFDSPNSETEALLGAWKQLRTWEALADIHYGKDIERSLSAKPIIQLQPLHKRILGLLEYALVPALQSQLNAKGYPVKKLPTSKLWIVAFTGVEEKHDRWLVHREGCLSPPLSVDCGLAASIEVEGHWLIEAQKQQAAGAASLDLAGLLDRLVMDISTAPEVTGIRSLDGRVLTLTLTPGNPGEQAQQLAGLRERGISAAACMTLYLGKIIVALRNYIEHGHDEVDRGRGCLKVDGTHYWQQTRNRVRSTRMPDDPPSTYQWVLDEAASLTPSWRDRGLLPTTPDPPATANSLLLSPASLHRCLVLLTLVLHAGSRHLGI